MPSPLRLALLVVVCLLAARGALAAPPAPVSHDITVALDPAARTLRGEAEIIVRGTGSFDLLLDDGFTVEAITLDGRPLAMSARRDRGLLRWPIPAGDESRSLRLAWHGTLEPLARGLEHRDTLGRRGLTADSAGSFLPAGGAWYPLVTRAGELLLHDYRLALSLPLGQRGLVAGTRLSETQAEGRITTRFEFPHPSEGIDLMAGPYRVEELATRSVDGRTITLRTYFHPELAPLAADYLASVRDYLALYEDWIGPYPFTTFSVVSSPTPTGFGMPSLTYLGIEVLKLPFIRSTSLGHEVLHNWWGNGVYPDYASGNWSEGLTTFMADYAYAERESADKARAMRLSWLRDLSGIPPGADRPLTDFTSRSHGISQAVGYSKTAMLFLMLRERLGEEAFDRGVRRLWRDRQFRLTGWDELRSAFEAEAKEDLGSFFAQWLTRAGLPELGLEAARNVPEGVAVTLAQSSPPYQLDVPLHLAGAGGTTMHRVRLTQPRQTFVLPADAPVRTVTLDPDSRVLRRLDRDEAPPILRELQLDRASALLVLGGAAYAEPAESLATRLLDNAPAPQAAGAAPTDTPLLVIGAQAETTAWLARHGLPPAPPEVAGQGDARMWTLRLASGAPVALIAADSPGALAAAIRPLPHYRQQSWLVLAGGKARARGVWPARAPSVSVARD